MLKVRLVISATPNVAVSPGSEPTMMPASVAHSTLPSVKSVACVGELLAEHVEVGEHRLRHADQEDAFEEQRDADAGADADDERDRGVAHALALRAGPAPTRRR